MEPVQEAPAGLSSLPGPCLLAVMQHCADDPRSLFSAARAHPTLHQASFLVLSSINWHVSGQQQLERIRYYLCKRGQHVNSITLTGPLAVGGDAPTIRQFPPNLKLHSLQLRRLRLQLQPGVASQGVLRRAAAPALKQLCLGGCMLLDGDEGLAAALAQLPGLEHLSLINVSLSAWDQAWDAVQLDAEVVKGLQALTYLELVGIAVLSPQDPDPAAQPLTRLVDLRVSTNRVRPNVHGFIACILQGSSQLTRLEIKTGGRPININLWFEPAVLRDKPHLQHLELAGCSLDGSVGVTQLLQELSHMQGLTHLGVAGCLEAEDEATAPPAAAYAALTASSKLQKLDMSDGIIPEGAWQHVFPTGRQLPHLRELNISALMHRAGETVAMPEATRLASCCPAVETLWVEMLVERSEQLPPLQQLSSLKTLHLAFYNPDVVSEVVGGLPPLSRLQKLSLTVHRIPEQLGSLLLLQLTQMRQLTRLEFKGYLKGSWDDEAVEACFTAEAPGDEPVWRQLLKHHLDHSNPEVAQQAAAALADSEAQSCSS